MKGCNPSIANGEQIERGREELRGHGLGSLQLLQSQSTRETPDVVLRKERGTEQVWDSAVKMSPRP